jgi:hypothetical protein
MPSKLFALDAPLAFMIFAPKDYVDFVLQSPNVPSYFNP